MSDLWYPMHVHRNGVAVDVTNLPHTKLYGRAHVHDARPEHDVEHGPHQALTPGPPPWADTQDSPDVARLRELVDTLEAVYGALSSQAAVDIRHAYELQGVIAPLLGLGIEDNAGHNPAPELHTINGRFVVLDALIALVNARTALTIAQQRT